MPLVPLVLGTLGLDWSYTTSFPGSPAYRWQVIGLLSFYNNVNQSLLINLYLSVIYLSMYRSMYMSIIYHLSIIICLSIYPSIHHHFKFISGEARLLHHPLHTYTPAPFLSHLTIKKLVVNSILQ